MKQSGKAEVRAAVAGFAGPVRGGSYHLGSLKVRHAGFSIQGSKRKTNDDRLYVAEEFGLIAIADGVGGSATGGRSAQDCVDLMQEYLSSAGPITDRIGVLRDAIVWTNGRMLAHSWAPGGLEKNPGGCCFAGVLLDERNCEFTSFHVGDAAVYVQERAKWRKLTVDHLEPTARGSVAGRKSRKPRITRAMGLSPMPKVDFATFPIVDKGRLLIASDGCDLTYLSDMGALPPAPASGTTVDDCARALATGVASGPMRDDSSAIIVEIGL